MSRLCLDTSLIEEFKNNGVVVVPSVLTTDEVAAALRGLKTYLLACGCDEDNLMDTAGCLTSLSSTNGAGGILDVFYEDWKLCLNEHSAVVGTIQSLWQHTYATYDGNEHDSLYKHPFGQFDPLEGYMYVDRVCYRVPSDVSAAFGPTKRKQLQRSLTPHLDCCPHNMYGKGSKWRPIQAFLCLTDTLLPDQGGFEACPGHHVNFEQWAENRAPSAGYKGDEGGQVTAPCVGDFTPIRPAEDKDVLQKMRHIPCKAGDLVCWDYRIPHANARHNSTSQPRVVVYVGLLPAVPLNAQYAQVQLERFHSGAVPTDQWHESTTTQKCDYVFSELGEKLMGIKPWK